MNKNKATTKKCYRCGRLRPLTEFHRNRSTPDGYQWECKECKRMYQAEYRRTHRDKIREWARRYKSRPEYRKKDREYSSARWRMLKKEAIMAYGGKCACCGEACLAFLEIDHIDNDGKKDREKHGSGKAFYEWLKKNNYPKGRYQVLCRNCNWVKHAYGTCPHQTGEAKTVSQIVREIVGGNREEKFVPPDIEWHFTAGYNQAKQEIREKARKLGLEV